MIFGWCCLLCNKTAASLPAPVQAQGPLAITVAIHASRSANIHQRQEVLQSLHRPSSCVRRTDVEESSHDTDFFAGLCGEFKLSPEQFTVFEEFSRTMRQCALAFLCVAVSNITLTMLQVREITRGPRVDFQLRQGVIASVLRVLSCEAALLSSSALAFKFMSVLKLAS